MSGLINLVQDFYFWIGALFFVLSIYGAIWIIKSLHKPAGSFPKNADETTGDSGQDEPLFPRPAIPQNSVQTKSVPAPPSTPKEVPSEALLKQLEKMQESLNASISKIEESQTAFNEKLTEDLKAILQILRSRAFDEAIKKEQEIIEEVSSKVGQVYQVLSSLSKPEDEDSLK
jgi:hypothetical protein